MRLRSPRPSYHRPTPATLRRAADWYAPLSLDQRRPPIAAPAKADADQPDLLDLADKAERKELRLQK